MTNIGFIENSKLELQLSLGTTKSGEGKLFSIGFVTPSVGIYRTSIPNYRGKFLVVCHDPGTPNASAQQSDKKARGANELDGDDERPVPGHGLAAAAGCWVVGGRPFHS